MKITDLRIGDVVCNKDDKFPMTVVAIFSYLGAPDDEGAVYLDFEGNEGDVLSEIVENLELCEPRYKLPAWRQVHKNSVGTYITIGLLSVRYEVAECDCGYQTFFFADLTWEAPHWKKIGKYPTLEDAKEAAERDFNELITSMIREIRQLKRGVL